MHVFLAELRKGIIERAYALPLPDVIFRPQMHQKRLAAGLRPDPLGEIKLSPSPPSRSGGGKLQSLAAVWCPLRGRGGEK